MSGKLSVITQMEMWEFISKHIPHDWKTPFVFPTPLRYTNIYSAFSPHSKANIQYGNSYYYFPDSWVGKESASNTGNPRSIPGLGTSTGEGIGSTPVFWSGEFHGLYSPWGHKESDTTERLSLSRPREGLTEKVPWTELHPLKFICWNPHPNYDCIWR